MKKFLLTLAAATALLNSNAQNTFPTPSGNVGIGTTSPTRQLEVISGAGVGPLKVSGPNGYLLIDNVGSGQSYYQANSFHQFLGNSATPIMTLFNSGYIGIGTITPAYTLDIHTTGGGPQINVQAAATSNGSIAYSTALGSWALGVGVGTAQNVFNLVSGNVEVLRITPSGNVGIGTTSPGAKLDVAVSSSTYTNNIKFGDTTPAYLTSGTTGIYFSNTSGNPVFMVQHTGNVGIGTTSPDALLAVKGTIHTQEVKVDMTGWSDYVFKTAYKLPRLSDVKNYIDQNHHLPDMPSEKQVIENGINLTEMLKMQQKKIEELTLYVIALQEQVHKFGKNHKTSKKKKA